MTMDTTKRYQLLDSLTALLPGQFEEILFRLDIPRHHLSGSLAPQSLRAVELLRFLEASDRSGELSLLLSDAFRRSPGDTGPSPQSRAAPQSKPNSINVFISYAERDRALMEELRRHLKPLERAMDLMVWDTSQIYAGASIQSAITSEINRADLVLTLLSPDFLFADQLLDLTTVAFDRQKRGISRLVPIILRPCDWSSTAFGSLQVLPRDGNALTQRRDRDAAWVDIIQGMRLILQDVRDTRRKTPQVTAVPAVSPVAATQRKTEPTQSSAAQRRPISDIFRTAGTPADTFVEPARFQRLRIALSTMGKGLVVEGPSGIGKTVAVKKALEELGQKEQYKILRAMHPPDVGTLEQLLSGSLRGHIIIDDCHHLTSALKARLANLIKYLADSDRRDVKLTLIGVNQAGMSLTSELPDLAGRVDIFVLGRQPDAKIEQLIEKGEHAANLAFVRRADFVMASLGSFYTAQQLCLSAAEQAGIEETMGTLTPIEAAPRDVMPDLMEELGRVFRLPLLGFTGIDSARLPRGACLALLWLIRQGQSGCVIVNEAKYQYPALTSTFSWLREEALVKGMAGVSNLSKCLFYDDQTGLLAIEDPRLEFYLRNLSFEQFGRHAGLQVRVGADDQIMFTQS